MAKTTPLEYEIHDLLLQRWSPRAFLPGGVEVETLHTLFEAARWAPSCFNEQPWRFFVARQEDKAAFETLSSCLAEANRRWAAHAPVLIMTVASKSFALNGNPNRYAWHDVGLAMGMLSVQATALGLGLHQMAGFDAQKARELLAIPDGFEPVTMVALGYRGEADTLPDDLKAREKAPRQRRKQSEFVFLGESWQTPVAWDDREIEEVLSFWLGEVDDLGVSSKESADRWFRKDAQFDREILDRFEGLYHAIVAGERSSWKKSARGRLAGVLVLDQFSRNMFRDLAKMYAADETALAWALEAIALGMDRAVGISGRTFFYMPLMHSETLAHQEQCVALFAALRDEVEGALQEQIANNLNYAIKHRDFVARFGRFPHRNAILGRESTPEEIEFLKQPGSSF